MRHTILFMLLAVSLASAGQNNPYSEFQKKFSKPMNNKAAVPQFDAQRKSMAILQAEAVHSLTMFGHKLAILPQDHMPCVVPDMTEYSMPNAWQAGASIVPPVAAIPNPAVRPVSPSVKKLLLKKSSEK